MTVSTDRAAHSFNARGLHAVAQLGLFWPDKFRPIFWANRPGLFCEIPPFFVPVVTKILAAEVAKTFGTLALWRKKP